MGRRLRPRSPEPAPGPALRGVALAGNLAALAAVALLLANPDRLFTPPTGMVTTAAALTSALTPPHPDKAHRVLWIVIDGLRADIALDPRWMRALAALAERG